MRQHTSMVGLALCAALAALAAGCGEELETGADEEEPLTEAKTSALVTGCAAITVTSEAHLGSLIGYSTPKRDLYIQRLEYRIKNPSTTNCASVQMTFQVKDTVFDKLIYQKSLTTSLAAGYNRAIYWNVGFDSRTYKPAVSHEEEALLLRNGNQVKQTYLPTYFINSGQY